MTCVIAIVSTSSSSPSEVSLRNQAIQLSSSSPSESPSSLGQISNIATFNDNIDGRSLSFTDKDKYLFMSKDKQLIAYTSDSSTIIRDSLDPTKKVVLNNWDTKKKLAFTNDNKKVAIAYKESLYLVDLDTQVILFERKFDKPVRQIIMLEDSKHAVLELKKSAVLWNLETNAIDYEFSIVEPQENRVGVSQLESSILNRIHQTLSL